MSSADLPHSDAPAVGPSPAEIDRRHRDLFGRRSVLGALAVLAVLCFFGFGLAAIDEAVKPSSGVKVGEAYTVSPTVSFTPAPGWVVDEGGVVENAVVTMTKNGVTMKMESLTLQPKDTVESFAKVFRDGDKGNGKYVTVSGLQTFVTTGGQHGVTWSATGPTDAAGSWMVADGSSLAWMPVVGPASNWASVEPDLEAMAKSIVVTAPATDGGS